MNGFDAAARPRSLASPDTGILATRAPALARAQVDALLLRQYGIRGRLSALASERDHNYRINATDGAAYVLKISHPEEDIEVVRYQNHALAHIAMVDPLLPVPALILDCNGAAEARVDVGSGAPRIVRLLSYLDGTMLYQTVPSALQDHNLGAFLARLGLALEDFKPAGPTQELLWDLRQMPRSRSLIATISDGRLRSLVEQIYDDFERCALDLLPCLRAQAVHNDMNPYNVIVHPQDPAAISGIIDFGDMVHGPLVGDIAVGAGYRWTLDEHPLAGIGRFLRGYVSMRKILDAELAVMFDLIRARLALTITIANWQSQELPENREYVLRLQDELTAAIHHLWPVSREDAVRFFRQAIALEH